MDFKNLIGLEIDKASKILEENGYNDIEISINSRKNERASDLVVCATFEAGTKVTLVCGEFCLDIEE